MRNFLKKKELTPIPSQGDEEDESSGNDQIQKAVLPQNFQMQQSAFNSANNKNEMANDKGQIEDKINLAFDTVANENGKIEDKLDLAFDTGFD